MIPLSLRSNFTWALAGTVFHAATQWATLVAVARLGSPRAVGLFALAFALCTPAFMGANLDLRSVQATDARAEFAFGHYLALRLITSAAALVAVGVIGLAAGHEVLLPVFAVGLAKAVDSLGDVVHGLLQGRERMDLVARSVMLRGALSLAAAGAVFRFTGSVALVGVGLAGASLAVLVLVDMRSSLAVAGAARLLRPRWERAHLVRLLRRAAPLGASSLLVALGTSVPRYAIEGSFGTAELGVFSALSYMVFAGSLVVTALGQSASQRLARHHARGERAEFGMLLLALVGTALLVAAAVALVSWLWGPRLLLGLYGEAYAARSDVLVALALTSFVTYAIFAMNVAVIATGAFRAQNLLALVSVSATTLGAYVLVPRHGLVGAALAIGMAGALQLAGSAFVVARATLERRTGDACASP